MNRVYVSLIASPQRCPPPPPLGAWIVVLTGLRSELESVFLGDLKWISMFCWLAVGDWARFLNLKGNPGNSLLGSTEFGRLWKMLEKIVLQLTEWLVTGFKTFFPAPVFVQALFGFFLTQFFWPNLSAEYTLPSELAGACFWPGYTVVGLFVSSLVSVEIVGSEVS